MPFYQGTKRVLMGAPARQVFLPNAGPFALGLDSIPPGPNVNTLSNFTLSTSAAIPSSRRKTMLKYNTLTINVSRTWLVSAADMCVFVWANRIILNGRIDTSGTDGGSGNSSDGGSGGAGAGGGGGGGGGLECVCGCAGSPSAGPGGQGSTTGQYGDDGQDSTICCVPYGSGGAAGSGVGLNNWADSSDGYDYVNDLHLDPEVAAYPFGFAGNGASGDFGGGGGGGGGAGGIQIYVCNSFTAGAVGSLRSAGGEPGLNTSSSLFAIGGDGGCIAVLVRTGGYDGSLNGKVLVPAGTSGSANGSKTIWEIAANGNITQRSFASAF